MMPLGCPVARESRSTFMRYWGIRGYWRSRGAELAAGLRERGVLVRHFNKPRIEDFLRITVGTDEECTRLIAAMRDLV